ncbi:hypothetical protein AKJ16_DCAP06193 [Drosera capensis]
MRPERDFKQLQAVQRSAVVAAGLAEVPEARQKFLSNNGACYRSLGMWCSDHYPTRSAQTSLSIGGALAMADSNGKTSYMIGD